MAQGGEKRDDSAVIILIWALLICGIVFISWMKMRAPIIMFVYSIAWVQYSVLKIVHLLDGNGLQYFNYVGNVLTRKINPGTISFDELSNTTSDIGSRTYIFWMAFIAFYTWIVHKKMLGNGCRRKFSLKANEKKKIVSFIEFQSKIWKTTKIVVGFDPEKTDISKHGRPLRIMEWMEKNKIPIIEGQGPDKKLMEAELVKQLGSKWIGYKDAPFYVQAVLALAMVSLQDYRGINRFRDKLSEIMANPDDNFVREEFEKLMAGVAAKDPKLIPEIDRIASNHAFTNVACLAVIGWCGPFAQWNGGQGQIIAPSMYQWLMRFDRTLYMVLQSHGRYSFFVEGVGAVSHYHLERIKGERYYEPFVSTAIDGIESALIKLKITDTEKFRKEIAILSKRYN